MSLLQQSAISDPGLSQARQQVNALASFLPNFLSQCGKNAADA
jgi:hypothetical protein